MSRRIDIELTSSRADGTWTWRAAGAQKPKGVLDGALLPAGAAVGQVLKAEADADVDGLTIVSVAAGKEKAGKVNLLEFIPSDKPFEAVTQTLARRERSDRGPRREGGERRPRRDGDDRGPRREGGEGSSQALRHPRSQQPRHREDEGVGVHVDCGGFRFVAAPRGLPPEFGSCTGLSLIR